MKLFLIIGAVLFLQALLTVRPASTFATTPPLESDSAAFTYVLFIPGYYVNDHCLIYANGEWHLFFTEGDMSIRPWLDPGNEIVIAHAVSPDLINWTVKAPALRIDPPGSLDAGHLYAPAIIATNGTYSMIFTGNERNFNAGEHMLMATSSDLYAWTRYSTAPIFQPDSNWAAYFPPGYDSSGGGPASGRDPFLVADSTYGYICYYVGRLKADSAHGVGQDEFACVAAATSPDLIHWADRGPVLTRRVMGDGNDSVTYTHPESPCMVRRGDRYYLFWKGGSGTRYVISDTPLDFQNRPEHFLATSHASKIFEWNEQWYITSCSRSVNDVTHTLSDRTRGLYLAGLDWSDSLPRLTTLPEPASVKSSLLQSKPGLYPNLVYSGEPVWIRPCDVGKAPANVVIYNVLGREALRISASNGRCEFPQSGLITINTEGLAAGAYIVHVDRSNASYPLIVR